MPCSLLMRLAGAWPQVVREVLPSRTASLRISIDATRVGNVARFINHACDGGNLVPVLVGACVLPPELAQMAGAYQGIPPALSLAAGRVGRRTAAPCPTHAVSHAGQPQGVTVCCCLAWPQVREPGNLLPRVCLYASCDIDAGQELFFSYGEPCERSEPVGSAAVGCHPRHSRSTPRPSRSK